MKKILFLLFFLPFICDAQRFIGVSREAVEAEFKKVSIKYELSPIPLEEKYIQFKEGVSEVKLFLKNDTVSYYNITSPSKSLNKTKQFYDEEFYIAGDWVWVNYVPHAGAFLYTTQFPSKNEFVTTVQKIK